MTTYFTSNSLRRYRARLDGLEARMDKTGKDIGEAARQGAESFHDNAPFEAARDELKLYDTLAITGRSLLSGAQIREYPRLLQLPPNQREVLYGTQVTLSRDGHEAVFQIVAHGDADIDKNRILYESPLALALLGRKVGDEFEARIGRRFSNFKVLKVEPLTDPDLFEPQG
jgi:transcription elongation GreA/GreB family factor